MYAFNLLRSGEETKTRKISLLYDLTPCSLVERHQCFRWTYCLQLHVESFIFRYLYTKLQGLIFLKTTALIISELTLIKLSQR